MEGSDIHWCDHGYGSMWIGIYWTGTPIRIGAAIGAAKAPAIAAAIRGKYFTTLFIDEIAAREVLQILENNPKVSSEKERILQSEY